MIAHSRALQLATSTHVPKRRPEGRGRATGDARADTNAVAEETPPSGSLHIARGFLKPPQWHRDPSSTPRQAAPCICPMRMHQASRHTRSNLNREGCSRCSSLEQPPISPHVISSVVARALHIRRPFRRPACSCAGSGFFNCTWSWTPKLAMLKFRVWY